MTEENKYWLQVNNTKMIADYGPFSNEKAAWEYYFGRDYSND